MQRLATVLALAACASALVPLRRAQGPPSSAVRTASSAEAEAEAEVLPPSFPPVSRYAWRGHSCAFRTAGAGPPVLLLHGFAGSAFNCWRSTLPALAATGP